MQSPLGSPRRSETTRLLVVGGLALLLLVPIGLIAGLVSERGARRDGAVLDVNRSWGNTQMLSGPALVVPYHHRWTVVDKEGRRIERRETRHATFLPATLRMQGQVDPEVRQRGIYEVPVYRLGLDVSGTFDAPSFDDLGIKPENVLWERAALAVGISDARAIQGQVELAWGDESFGFLPGVGRFLGGQQPGIHVELGDAARNGVPFSFALALNGSVGLYATPFGRDTELALTSSWPSPSFQGQWLPVERTISADGFTSRWSIPFLGRSYPQAWTSTDEPGVLVDQSRFGVDLVSTVDAHSMSHRSVKYAILFVLIAFGSIWLIEILGGIRVHPIQYLLLGAAMCVFYLLELSLAEHIGFGAAYLIACLLVVGLMAAYARSILGTTSRAMVLAAVAGSLYVYLYVVLTNEDYALLIGSAGLFAMLALVMFLTRRVDWYGAQARLQTQTAE